MTRTRIPLLGLLAAAAMVVLPHIASGASSARPVVAGGCRVSAQATIEPGLTFQDQTFTYHYSGKLSGCSYTTKRAPKGGTITAGETIKIGGKTYQEPKPEANGSCLGTTSTGYDFAKWADGTQTIVQFSTKPGSGGTQLTGMTIPTLKLTSADGQSTATFRSTRFVNQYVIGQLKFTPSDASLCGSSGLTSATITGLLGHVGDK
jgi:hypothetical protein